MRVKIDAGGRTYLPLCACGWRGLPAMDRGSALNEARHHERRAHPGDLDAAQALSQYGRRRR